jgi:hypothetical protein
MQLILLKNHSNENKVNGDEKGDLRFSILDIFFK